MTPTATTSPSDRTAGEDPVPMSEMQRGIWFEEQLSPGTVRNHISAAVIISSELDVDRFRHAVHRVVDLNPLLRAEFTEVDGSPHQCVSCDTPVSFEFVEGAELSRKDVDDLLRSHHATPFDLLGGPPIRFLLLRLADGSCVFSIAAHHLVTDLWSLVLIWDEIRRLYEDETINDRRARTKDYAEFVRAEAEVLANSAQVHEHYRRRFDAWTSQSVDWIDTTGVGSGLSQIVAVDLTRDEGALVAAAATELGVSVRSVVLAAFQVALHRNAHLGSVVVGELRANRSPRFASLVGCCINVVPRFAEFTDGLTLRELVDHAEYAERADRQFDRFPFRALLRGLRPDHGADPFFGAMFGWQRSARIFDESTTTALAFGLDAGQVEVGTFRVEPTAMPVRSAASPLTLLGGGGSSGLRLAVEYQLEVVARADVERLARDLGSVLRLIVSEPDSAISDIDLRSEVEREREEAAWRDATREHDEHVTTLDLIDGQIRNRRDAIAVADSKVSITYGELDARGELVARCLRGVGVIPGDLVGIVMDRTVDMVAAILGTWKCRAGYVPMDPNFPAERLEMMVEDARLTTVISSPRVIDRFSSQADEDRSGLFAGLRVIDVTALTPPDVNDAVSDVSECPAGHDLAYVIFTSGSTGRPKGVAVEHRNVVNFLRSMAVRPGITEADVMIAATTLSFDISVLELFLPLTVGAQVTVVDREVAVDPRRLASALRSATVAQGTPTMWKMLVDSGWTCDPEFTILCGGEALSLELGTALKERSNSVWNMYGPTETTVWSAVARLDECDPVGPFFELGAPIDNTRLYVLDGDRLAPDGVSGELWIGGAGVARGYLTSEEMTAARFVPDPFFGTGERMYRTGDLVRREPSGALTFLGRADGQIKLRGHRIELGEIESVLARHEQVDQAVVVVREFGDGDQRLVAYVTPAVELGEVVDIDLAGVRALARGALPPYMVPATIVELDCFPLTPNNKVDRNALPNPAVAPGGDRARSSEDEDTATLQVVLQSYCEVLGNGGITADDDFFDLGGHSLLATRICSRLHDRLDREVPVRAVFEHSTPRRLARSIDEQVESLGQSQTIAVGPVTVLDPAISTAMSLSQERMLFLHLLNPSDTSYNLAGALRVRGPLDLDALRVALSRLVERHTGLRSTFHFVENEPHLVVHEPFTVDVRVTDWSDSVDVDRMDAALARFAAAARTPFDLRVLTLFRVEVHVLASDDHLIGIAMHHIISDQWSFGVISRELDALYRAVRAGHDVELADVAPRPEQYARWHRDQLSEEPLGRLLAYWREQLRDLPTVEYPSDHPRSSIRARPRSGTITIEVPESLVDGVRARSSSEQATEFMTLLAAFATVLHRATGAEDIPIGVPIANRHRLASEGLITSLVNTLVMRADLSGRPDFGELVRRVREMALDAYAHQDMPFERLVVELSPARDTSRSPLFQYFFNVQNAPFELPDLDGLEIEVVRVPSAGAQFDISMTVDVAVTRTITLDYSADLFDETTMMSLLESYVDILESVVADARSSVGSRDVAVVTQPSDGAALAGPSVPEPLDFESPRAGIERQLASIWERELGVSGISRHDDFFDLGGYSLLAVRIFNDIEHLTGRRPPMITLFDAPTIAEFATLLESEGWLSPWTSLVRVRGSGTGTPFFLVAPFLISALSFHDLARDLGDAVPFYVLQPQGLEDDLSVHVRVEDMAAHYIRELKTVQPHGPYVIGGHCAGAWVAFEVVRQLEAAGDPVDRLIVVDVAPPGVDRPHVRLVPYVWSRAVLYGRSGRLLDAIRWDLSLRLQRLRNSSRAQAGARRAAVVRRRHAAAHSQYQGGTIRSDLTFIRSDEWAGLADKDWHLDWITLTSGRTTTVVIPGSHAGLLTGQSGHELATALREALNRP